MDQQSEQALRLVPEWDKLDAVITPLVGGITNQNYRVAIGDESFVLRVGGKGTHLLGIDRERERDCTAITAHLGIGAEVVYFHASQTSEVLVTRFIAGTAVSAEEAAQPEILKLIAETIRRYHTGQAFPGSFSPFETVRSYYHLALARGVSFPETLSQIFALMDQIEKAIGPDQPSVPCHNDLLASNFLKELETIRIVDWEYAGMGDRFFDLGNFAANQELDEEQCSFFLHAYAGEARAADLAHLHLMRLASDLREAFWGFLQLGISELVFDYREYAQHHLQRFLHNVTMPQFAQWLHDMQA